MCVKVPSFGTSNETLITGKNSAKYWISVNSSYKFVVFTRILTFKKKESEQMFSFHFPKIHRSVLCKITIDLYYFWDVYDVNLWEKNLGKSTAYSCRTNAFI